MYVKYIFDQNKMYVEIETWAKIGSYNNSAASKTTSNDANKMLAVSVVAGLYFSVHMFEFEDTGGLNKLLLISSFSLFPYKRFNTTKE